MLSQVCHKCNKPYEDLGYCSEAKPDRPSIDLDSHHKEVDLGAHYRHSFMGHKIDVYRILEIFDVTDPVAQHIIKKLLRGENKGHTMDFVWNEVFQACDRKKEMMEEDSA